MRCWMTGLVGVALANHPNQWVADYAEFTTAHINEVTPKPKNVVLVGVSEAALASAKVATISSMVTHLAIVGSGGYSMRQSLTTLGKRGAIPFDVNSGWSHITADPISI